jgi:tetratricopeptide (TPR) repeat protein
VPEVAAPTQEAARIQAAVAKVLQDKTFRRASVMSRLLQYLVDRALAGIPVKSYTIATEALGRAADDGADADTYARVAVGRLRKALIAYYASHPDEDEIYIDAGSYAVLIRNRAAAPMIASPQVASFESLRGRILADLGKHQLLYAIICLALLTVIVAVTLHDNRQSQRRWAQPDFPTVALMSDDEDTGSVPTEVGAEAEAEAELDSFGNILRATLADYFGFRLIEAGEAKADYEIRLDVDQSNGAKIETVSLVESATKRIVWTRSYPVSRQADIVRSAGRAAAAIAAPGGALNSFGRRKGIKANTPYGCWLRFTGSVMSYSSRTDSELLQCAEDWHAADEGSRTAAFLRNWTMVDASMTTLIETRRRDELEAALTVVHQALTRNPENAMLYIGEMRTYSFLGKRDEVRQAARSAIEAAPGNRVIAGLAGTWLAFWNDPQGRELLDDLETDSETALPWEHAGQFVVGMMDDDAQSAGHHLAFLRFYMEDQPALNLLEAAYNRRIGRPQAAEEALDKIRNHPRAWIAGPDMIMQRMPLAPEVKARLRQWLAYDARSPVRQSASAGQN